MRLRYLDVLKAFAIIAVVLYHLGVMPFGYLGVDLFLVINGFLITKGLERRILSVEKVGWGGYFNFERSRIERLLPPLIWAGIICMALGYVLMINDTYESLSQSVIATSLFGNNVVELIATGDYWATDKLFSPLMHTWYVGIVMQFYLVYPLLFFIAKLDKFNPHRTLLLLVSVLGLLSLLLFIGDTDTARRFYLLPARFFEFAAGGLVALIYKPGEGKIINKHFIYSVYVLLLFLLATEINIIPANVKLLSVVSISCVMLCSQDTLENWVTGNALLAKLGEASYSIFIWHQIVLAFFRGIFGSDMGVARFSICIGVIALLSCVSYHLVEKRVEALLKSFHGRRRLYIVYGVLFIALNTFAVVIYKNAGVVRDIPELGVSYSNPERDKWADYNSRILKLDTPFETDKTHWFIVGNSYGRDFANMILESCVSDKIEISYCGIKEFAQRKYEDRFKDADLIFIASKGIMEEDIRKIELLALAFGHSLDDVIVVGEKYFGETMTEVYSRRFRKDYFETSVKLKDGMLDNNEYFKVKYGSRYIDLIGMIQRDHDKVRVFSDDHFFISSDCKHLTQMGACFFANKIDWGRYLNKQQ